MKFDNSHRKGYNFFVFNREKPSVLVKRILAQGFFLVKIFAFRKSKLQNPKYGIFNFVMQLALRGKKMCPIGHV